MSVSARFTNCRAAFHRLSTSANIKKLHISVYTFYFSTFHANNLQKSIKIIIALMKRESFRALAFAKFSCCNKKIFEWKHEKFLAQ